MFQRFQFHRCISWIHRHDLGRSFPFTKETALGAGPPGFGLLATGAAMGTRTAQDFTLQLDGIIGSGFSAIWIGLLGLSLMATGLVLQSATVPSFALGREFGLD